MKSSSVDDSYNGHRLADDARMIAGYEIVREIAHGGNGRVYEVRAPGGIAKAAKIITLEPDNPLTEREVEGLRLIRGVRHPYLVSIDRVDVERDHITLIMELADCSLREMQAEFLASGATGIPRERLVPWLVEAAEALDVLNFKYGIRHLDVKPENLFLVAEHLKVGDYGLAREAGRNVVDPDANAVTPAYAAPELFDSQISATSDQYSLAVVYMEMSTGALPFRTTNLRQLALYHLTRQPDLVALPFAERFVVGRALSRDPSKRFHSCVEFMEALVGAEASSARRRPPSHAETIRARGATVRIPPPISKTSSLMGPTSNLKALAGDSALSETRCFVTDQLNDAVRAVVKKLADASLGEWFDFGETLAAYRVKDATGSLLVGVRLFSRDATGPTLLEATITRNGASATSFDRQAASVFESLTQMLAARPDDGAGRREPRMQVQCPVTLFPVSGPMRDQPIPCTAVNTSSRGLGAVSLVPIDADMVRIRPASWADAFEARIVYCRPSASGRNFLVGMELTEAPTERAWLSPSTASPSHAARA